MKLFLSFAIMLFAVSLTAQRVDISRLRPAPDSLDQVLVPTAKGTKFGWKKKPVADWWAGLSASSKAELWAGAVDTFYLADDTIWLVQGGDSWPVDVSSLGGGGDSIWWYSTSYNVALGEDAIAIQDTGFAKHNVGIGYKPLSSLLNLPDPFGSRNIAIGGYSLALADSTLSNIAIGYEAMDSVIYAPAVYNIAIGEKSLRKTNGASNVSIGRNSLRDIRVGGNNTVVGSSVASTQDSLSQCVYLGSAVNPSANNVTNEISIGQSSTGKGSHTANIGNSSITVLYLAQGPGWFRGTGSPENVVTAPVGSFYSRTDGGTGTSFYVKESGSGNTGWVSK